MSKKKKFLSASSLRAALLILLLTITVGGTVFFTYAVSQLKTSAIEVSHKKVDAVASNGSIQALMKTQKELDQNKDVLEKIGLIKSSSQFPEFQVVNEVRSIAAKNNVQIESFTYGGASSTTTPGATTPSQAITTSSSGKTIALSVILGSTDYLNFLQFIYDIEQHLPKMKIQGIDITKGGGTVAPVVVEMYIK